MPKHHRRPDSARRATPAHDELPGIDAAALAGVTGGAGADMSSMMMMMMMKRRSAPAAAAAPAAPLAPPLPKILVDGVEQPASALTGNGGTFQTTV